MRSLPGWRCFRSTAAPVESPPAPAQDRDIPETGHSFQAIVDCGIPVFVGGWDEAFHLDQVVAVEDRVCVRVGQRGAKAGALDFVGQRLFLDGPVDAIEWYSGWLDDGVVERLELVVSLPEILPFVRNER